MLNHKDSDGNNFWNYRELINSIRTETHTKQRWQMDNKAPTQWQHNSRVLITNKKVKYIEKPEQLQ